ncbi:hypothetical protein Ciccas_008082 [Cichlidogyrus casuarinus]|uniref:Uncharacterized protein n=1 Tax=Cichlidogyrus casuarinus TaxID=1844966 RepID=A0ABD2Q111_9PLAT
MLADSERSVRTAAAERVISLRKEDGRALRQLSLGPKGKFRPGRIMELKHDCNHPITPPPILRSIPDTILINTAKEKPIQYKQIPCHSQAVERAVQNTASVATRAASDRKRAAMLVAKAKAQIKRRCIRATH